jgi:hypothetical protein
LIKKISYIPNTRSYVALSWQGREDSIVPSKNLVRYMKSYERITISRKLWWWCDDGDGDHNKLSVNKWILQQNRFQCKNKTNIDLVGFADKPNEDGKLPKAHNQTFS